LAMEVWHNQSSFNSATFSFKQVLYSRAGEERG